MTVSQVRIAISRIRKFSPLLGKDRLGEQIMIQ